MLEAAGHRALESFVTRVSVNVKLFFRGQDLSVFPEDLNMNNSSSVKVCFTPRTTFPRLMLFIGALLPQIIGRKALWHEYTV